MTNPLPHPQGWEPLLRALQLLDRWWRETISREDRDRIEEFVLQLEREILELVPEELREHPESPPVLDNRPQEWAGR